MSNKVLHFFLFFGEKFATFLMSSLTVRMSVKLCRVALEWILLNRTEHTFIISQVKYMTYELYNKNNKEAWKTYVNYTSPGVFMKSPVLASIGNHWRHFL